jgi:hypothetical protein
VLGASRSTSGWTVFLLGSDRSPSTRGRDPALLFAKAGEVICRNDGEVVRPASPTTVSQFIDALPERTRYQIAFPLDMRAVRGSLPGMLWTTIAFTGTIGLGRAFDRERENDTMRALLLAPVRLAVFLGKAIAITLLVLGSR